MIYPIVLTALSLMIVTLMLIYIVPRVVGVFENTGQELPLLTLGLIGLSEFIQRWWWAILLVAGGVAFGIAKTLAREGPRRSFHGWLLRIPVIGRVVRGVNTARFTRTMAILSSSGVPIVEALRISAAVVGNLPMRDAVNEASVRVREGAAIGRSLAQSKLFPPMTMHLIASGEASGELDTMLERAATHQESEMNGLISSMLSLLEPSLIILMGLTVLLIVLAILLPIFQINQLV
jgi:general secretion pathway protein F